MSNNILFDFINTYSEETAVVVRERARLVKSVNRDGRPYFRLELSPMGSTPLHDDKHVFTLRDHHLSVYETEHRRIAALSQYHYTARYTDETGDEYKVHVYFNSDGDIVKAPDFRKIIHGAGGDATIPVTSSTLNHAFAEAAKSHSTAIVGAIRTILELKIKEHLARYNALEQHAAELSKAMAPNFVEYNHTLIEMSSELERLIPLVRDSRYAAINKFLKQMSSAVQRQAALEAAGADTTPTDESTTPVDTAAPDISTVAAHRAMSAPVLLDKRIYRLADVYASMDKKDPALTARFIGSIFRQINELSLDESTAVTLPALEALHRLYKEVQQYGETLFQELVLRRDVKALGSLSAFNELINEQHISLALQVADPSLLDFLLTHGHFSLNEQSVHVSGVTYPSAVHFCYEQHSTAMPLVDCFAVLIKHDASLLAQDRDGLPIAHILLSNLHHPLRKAFSLPGAAERTAESPLFYKQLISALREYLKSTLSSREERAALEHHIKLYASDIKRLENSMSNPSLREKSAVLVEKHFASSADAATEHDPEVAAAYGEMISARSAYLAKLSKRERLSAALEEGDGTEASVEALLSSDHLSRMSPEEKKAVSIRRARLMTEVYTRYIRQTELNEMAPRLKKLHNQKPYNDLVTEYKTIVSAIAALKAQLATVFTLSGDTGIAREEPAASHKIGQIMQKLSLLAAPVAAPAEGSAPTDAAGAGKSPTKAPGST